MFDPPSADTLEALSLIRVARHFGCPAWELARQPAYWLDMGLLDMEVDAALASNARKNGKAFTPAGSN
ncbi:MAG: hypothetical protein QMD04_08675 [Anaerolineales bacterium]|nr:hypothetical protein [Anaerolineales bacterium]